MLKRYAMCGGGARLRPNGVENRRGPGRVGSETTRPPSLWTGAVEFPESNPLHNLGERRNGALRVVNATSTGSAHRATEAMRD